MFGWVGRRFLQAWSRHVAASHPSLIRRRCEARRRHNDDPAAVRECRKFDALPLEAHEFSEYCMN